MIKNLRKLRLKKLLFFLGWFVVGVLPVVFLPIHKKTYYLALALPGFWMGIGYLASKMGRVCLAVLVGMLLVLNIASVKLGERTYWAVNRARIAEKVLNDFRAEYQELPRGAEVLIKNDPDYEIFSEEWGGTSRQAFYALSGSDAIQLMYGDFDLRVFYEDFDGEAGEYDYVLIARFLD